MKYAVEMHSDAKICISSFIVIGSAFQKLIRGRHRQNGYYIRLLSFFFFQTKETMLNM
jgi:hypothetical protein